MGTQFGFESSCRSFQLGRATSGLEQSERRVSGLFQEPYTRALDSMTWATPPMQPDAGEPVKHPVFLLQTKVAAQTSPPQPVEGKRNQGHWWPGGPGPDSFVRLKSSDCAAFQRPHFLFDKYNSPSGEMLCLGISEWLGLSCFNISGIGCVPPQLLAGLSRCLPMLNVTFVRDSVAWENPQRQWGSVLSSPSEPTVVGTGWRRW